MNKLPPPLWCLNECNGCQCKQTFYNIDDYKIHQEYCLFDENNKKRLEDDKKKEEEIEIDDDTLNIIESYERMTNNNVFMQILLGQFDYNLLDKIKKKYFYDLEEEYYQELSDSEDNFETF